MPFKKNIKVAIVGTRGIPNEYGGFEQFAQFLSKDLAQDNFDVTIYNPHFHHPDVHDLNGVNIVHKWCPESLLGAAAHFIFDFLSLKDAINKNFDIILELGYGTSAISIFMLQSKTSIIVTNMDGMEWKRDKWSPLTKKFMHWSESIAVQKSDYLISDNKGISDYILKTYNKNSTMIPYGTEEFKNPDQRILGEYQLKEDHYFMLIARLEPENNIEMILDGYTNSKTKKDFIVIGNYKTKYGKFLKKKYANNNVQFLNGIYDINIINNLRYYSKLYFHGHSVGGTNPSLLEAMGCRAQIIAHDNLFNRNVLGEDAHYFKNSKEVSFLLNNLGNVKKSNDLFIDNNINKIRDTYSWKKINESHINFFNKIIMDKK
tara:strand:- start:3575 stop:4696 length:1122 start_codon:yes stop_codon:yes gene_type:complete